MNQSNNNNNNNKSANTVLLATTAALATRFLLRKVLQKGNPCPPGPKSHLLWGILLDSPPDWAKGESFDNKNSLAPHL